MEIANHVAVQKNPWNKGKLVGQKPPLRLKEIWAIRIRLQLAKRARELALFNLALDRKLHGFTSIGLDCSAYGKPIPCAKRRPPLIYRRTKNCEPYNLFSAIQSSKTPSATSALRWTTLEIAEQTEI